MLSEDDNIEDKESTKWHTIFAGTSFTIPVLKFEEGNRIDSFNPVSQQPSIAETLEQIKLTKLNSDAKT